MRYLYGDSTDFPLNENFIETLSAATDAAIALLEADEALDIARLTTTEANGKATGELADIDEVWSRMETALALREHLSVATDNMVANLLRGANEQIQRARAGVKTWRDATVRRANEPCGPAAVMAPVNAFMVHHELPFTTWGLRWKAGGRAEPVQAQVYATMQRGLMATLGVRIPKKHGWSRPRRVAEFERTLVVRMMGKKIFGGERVRDEHLERYWITRVTKMTERDALVLSKKPKDPSPGLRVSFRDGDEKRIMVVRIDENEVPTGEPIALTGVEAASVQRLWDRVEETTSDLVAHRSSLLAATLHGKAITGLERPAMVAVAFIKSIAPLVREMRLHSQTATELCLKRDLADGRREEMFIAHAAIRAKWAHLTRKRQVLFEEYGLGARARQASRSLTHDSVHSSRAAVAAHDVHAAEPAPSSTRPLVRSPEQSSASRGVVPSTHAAAPPPLPTAPSVPPPHSSIAEPFPPSWEGAQPRRDMSPLPATAPPASQQQQPASLPALPSGSSPAPMPSSIPPPLPSTSSPPPRFVPQPASTASRSSARPRAPESAVVPASERRRRVALPAPLPPPSRAANA